MTFRAKRGLDQVLASLDTEILRAHDPFSASNYIEALDTDEEIDLVLIRRLLDRGIEKLASEEVELTTTLDQWLAPRLHNCLRISRRLAGDMGFWTWLVIEVGRPYTWTRWNEKERPTMYRYTGDFKRNSLARLWWFAEMSRNGPDYLPIKYVLRDASTAQYALELRYSMYRPAVIAFGNVAERGDLGFAAVKDLSKRANAYLSLKALEAIGLDQGENDPDYSWWNTSPVAEDLLSDEDMVGPRDNFASSTAIQNIEDWLETLILEAKTLVNGAT